MEQIDYQRKLMESYTKLQRQVLFYQTKEHLEDVSYLVLLEMCKDNGLPTYKKWWRPLPRKELVRELAEDNVQRFDELVRKDMEQW